MIPALARTDPRGREFAMQPARSRRWFDLVRWLFLFVLLAVLCRPRMALAETRVLTDADNGGTFHLRAGDMLELRLRSNPSTGYMWSVQAASTPLLKLTGQSQTKPTEPGVGRPIFQIFRFQPARRGRGMLLLHYVRSWEKPAPGEQQFAMRVRIR